MKRLISGLSALVLFSVPLAAQTTSQPRPGFNLFTVNQDVEIGRQSAIAAEKQLVLLRDARTDAYLNRIVQRLSTYAPGARYPYQIKTVNASEINAFALPGGPMYVNRGLLQTARTEAELAGALAHEMSHIALRHGTHQASKAYLSQAGLGILGGLLGRGSDASKVLNTVGGVGLNALFLKFSRDDEYEADQVGADIMAKAGYNPVAMATMFELLRAEQGRNPSKLEQFFSSHPSPANREARIREHAATLGGGNSQVLGGFSTMRSRLSQLPGATGAQVVAENPFEPDTLEQARVDLRVAPPSGRFARFSQPSGFFTVDYPDNWTAYPSGYAASLAPDGGVVMRKDGRQVMLYGVIINHYAPFAGSTERWNSSLQRSYAPFEDRTRARGYLEDATDDLVRTLLSSNSYLRPPDGVAQSEVIDGAQAFSVVLTGISPVTGQEEQVTVFTRALPDGHVIYALFVVPSRDADAMQRTYTRMVQSLRVNDAAAHRTVVSSFRP